MNDKIANPVEIDETALDDVNGGLLPAVRPDTIAANPGGDPGALLLPAVQKVREATARLK